MLNFFLPVLAGTGKHFSLLLTDVFLQVPSTLNSISSILQVMVECVDFSPYSPQFQQKLKCKRISNFILFWCIKDRGLTVLCSQWSSSHSGELDEKEKQGPGESVHLPDPAGPVSPGLSGRHRDFFWCHRNGSRLHLVCPFYKPCSCQHCEGDPDITDPTSDPAV